MGSFKESLKEIKDTLKGILVIQEEPVDELEKIEDGELAEELKSAQTRAAGILANSAKPLPKNYGEESVVKAVVIDEKKAQRDATKRTAKGSNEGRDIE